MKHVLTSNSNHRLKSAVNMPICVLKRRDLCVFMCIKRGKLYATGKQNKKMAANLDLFHMHLHRKFNANTKIIIN